MTLTLLRQREPTSSVLSDRVLEAYFNQPPVRGSESVSPLAARLLMVGLILVFGVVVVGLRVLNTQPDGPAHPESWDPRVAPYVAAVERVRGEMFLRPVYVDFLSEKAFTAHLSVDPPEFSAQSPTPPFLDRHAPATVGDADDLETLGYYSFEDERIRVRGEALTPAMAPMLVQELTHALQDQHFDLGMHLDLLRDDHVALLAFRTVLEADARRVEMSWRDTPVDSARAALQKVETDHTGELNAGAGKFPSAPTGRLSALGDLGQAMVSSSYRIGGNAAVDDLLRRPPTTEEHLLDPWTLVEDREFPIPVRQPRLTPTDRSLGEGTFGAVEWLLLLEERLPAKQALRAALGWGGDSYQVFERGDGRTCLRVNYTGDTPDDIREMRAALQEWVGGTPTRISSASREGSMVKFGTCAASARAHTPASSTMPAVRLALAQTHLTTTLLNAGFRAAEARCAADHLAQTFTLAELDDLRVQGPRAQRVIAACVDA